MSDLVGNHADQFSHVAAKYDFNSVDIKTYYENMHMQLTEIFSPVKIENFTRKFLIFLTFLLKIYIVGTRWNRLAEA